MRSGVWWIFGLVLLSLQPDRLAIALDEKVPGSDEIEEIIVIGQRSPSSMRTALVEAQVDNYEMFNAAIADPKFEISSRR